LHEQLKAFYSDIGRPSVDPELMIRMLLVGYCYGIRHERRPLEASNIDGDTLEIHGTRVRLWGADAPEKQSALRGRGSPCVSLRLLSHRRARSSNRDPRRNDRERGQIGTTGDVR
jgi:hypothetical protein